MKVKLNYKKKMVIGDVSAVHQSCGETFTTVKSLFYSIFCLELASANAVHLL